MNGQQLANSKKAKPKSDADLVCEAIGERNFTVAAKWFNEGVPESFHITRQSVWNWAVGYHEPDERYLYAYVKSYPDGDPRKEMAKAIMVKRNEEILAFWSEVFA